MIAKVEPLSTARALRGPFDYRLREDHNGVAVGSLLRIPFARRKLLGIVVGLAETSELDPDRLAEPDAVLNGGLPPDLVELGLWMAAEYCSTPARALGMMLAPGAVRGAQARAVLVAELTAAGEDALDGAEQPAAGSAIDRRLTDRQRAVLERLHLAGPTVAATLGTATLRRLERRGLVTLDHRAERRRPAQATVGVPSGEPPTLTEDQDAALHEVLAALPAPVSGAGAGSGPEGPPPATAQRRLLLHGVTGSGKTEVYLRAVEATLAAGRGALVLVPEIGLTPQAVGRFTARFGDVVAVLHSALGQGERYDEWMRLRNGDARVCVGPRSAVFAPLADIGLVVIDEEHDSSYKNEGDPRYDARTVARHRAEKHGALLLCGSATPRPESVASLRRLRLPHRVDGRPLPPVEVLDMRGQHHPLHPRTRMALADVRRGGRKAIVLLNRRGWSNFLSCRACGRTWICPNCEVSLVLHSRARPDSVSATGEQAGGGFVACHHCGHREPAPERCGACGSAAVARHGAGTQRLEHELRAALGDDGFPIFRLDADIAGGKDRAGLTLARFEAAAAGVLVGTQMVAKGHDFPEVTLGVVLDADQTLRFPDFRAEERTFALITQLAGRAGRGDAGGAVLVQTLAPDARSIVRAARHDADAFLEDELGRRDVLGYPPYGSLIRIVCSAQDAGDASSIAASLHQRIATPGATVPRPTAAGVPVICAAVLGPAPLFRLRGRARSQLVVKASDRLAAISAVGAAVEAVAQTASRRQVSISVDVDPQ